MGPGQTRRLLATLIAGRVPDVEEDRRFEPSPSVCSECLIGNPVMLAPTAIPPSLHSTGRWPAAVGLGTGRPTRSSARQHRRTRAWWRHSHMRSQISTCSSRPVAMSRSPRAGCGLLVLFGPCPYPHSHTCLPLHTSVSWVRSSRCMPSFGVTTAVPNSQINQLRPKVMEPFLHDHAAPLRT